MRTAKLTFSYEWVDADGNIHKPSARQTLIPYDVAASGEQPVLDGAAQGSEVDISFQGMTVAATLLIVENLTHQNLGMAWLGNFLPDLPAGATLILACPVAPVLGVVLSLRFFLRQVQAGRGFIAWSALGS